MNKLAAIFLIAVLFLASDIYAQYTNEDNDDTGAPMGMEVKKVNNDVSVLIPKGARMYSRNSSTFVEESADEYAARNVTILSNRLKKLEAENRELAEQIKYLRAQLLVPENKAAENVKEDNNGEKVSEEE